MTTDEMEKNYDDKLVLLTHVLRHLYKHLYYIQNKYKHYYKKILEAVIKIKGRL